MRGNVAFVPFGSLRPQSTPTSGRLRFDASVARERSATAAAQLVVKLGEHIVDDIVMHVRCPGHRPDGEAVDELVTFGLLLLPGEELVHRHRRAAVSVMVQLRT
jgi:hypothetical protein